MIQIKDFSKQSDFSIRMLRYLEEIELLIPSRGQNNYRYYNEKQLTMAKQIKELQNLGFQLKEIKDIKNADVKEQISITSNVLDREKDIAEIKSETIPKLFSLIKRLEDDKRSLLDIVTESSQPTKKIRDFSIDEKFKRSAYSMPILRTIYEGDLVKETEIDLIQTDILKFGQYLEEVDYNPQVFSMLNESAFAFGKNLTDDFLTGYRRAWEKITSHGQLVRLENFSKEELSELMGKHDVIIKTFFKHKNGEDAEIVIPYAPIYALTQLK